MPRYTYTVSDDAVVSVFDSENLNEDGSANISQPFHPIYSDKKWTKEEAQAWADVYIAHLHDPEPAAEFVDPTVHSTEEDSKA